MKYRNASEILPDALLKELQKYAAGEALYIPAGKERKQWGAGSGAKQFYKERNREIQVRFLEQNAGIEALAEEYGLAPDTVRKIVYR